LTDITPYRLTLLTAIVSLCILGAVAAAVLLIIPGGSPQNAATLLGFLAPTIGALVAVYRGESNAIAIRQNATTQQLLHEQNRADVSALQAKIDGLSSAAAAAAAAATLTAQQTLSDAGLGPAPGGSAG
jgi:hypothetical protein